jgi:hypothetical protein
MTGLSRDTVADFAKYFRQLIADSLEEEDTIIGGDGGNVFFCARICCPVPKFSAHIFPLF